MKSPFLSRFTPSLMSPEALEAIFVQRQELAKKLVDSICSSVINQSKTHRLLIGNRGIGKTHLVSLVYYRISKIEDLRERLLIAWLREEEWGIGSFLDMRLRILRSLWEGEGKQAIEHLKSRVDDLYKLSADEAEQESISLLQEVMGKKTLLLLIENLDDLFSGLGKEGQNKFYSFLQENNCAVLATSTTRFEAINQETSAFYNFFDIQDLEDFSTEEATQLLLNIAKLEGKSDLESYIRTPTGKSRIQAVHHLAGGNPRLYVILSEFLTRQSLDELVEPFMRMLDDLTPYYQGRMRELSSQQRKIIEFLTDFRHAISVKEIAQHCFVSHQTASSQLKDLRDRGYVRVESIGREAFYELREPMMRFCLEVKKQRGQPIRLFVDFLRCWYTREELWQRLGMEPHSSSLVEKEMRESHLNSLFENEREEPHPKRNSFLSKERGQKEEIFSSVQPLPEDAIIEREYIMKALEEMDREKEEDSRFVAYRTEFNSFWEKEDYTGALEYARKLVENRGNSQDWVLQGRCLNRLKNYQDALDCFDKAIEIEPNNSNAWYNRGNALWNLGRYKEAIESYDKALAIKPDDTDAWYNRGNALDNLGRNEEAIESYDKALAIKPDDKNAWNNRGSALDDLGRYEEAIESYDKVIAIKPDDTAAWINRGNALDNLGRNEEAIESYDKALAIKPDHENAWNNRGWRLILLEHYQEALVSCDQAISLGKNEHNVFANRAVALTGLNRWEESLISLEDALKKLDEGKQANLEYPELILRILFTNTAQTNIWKNHIQSLIQLFHQYKSLSPLSQGIVRNIPTLMSETVSNKAVQTWLQIWQELAANYPEFEVALRLLNTAVRYRENKGDRRILLELAIEERKLLEDLLNVNKPIRFT